MKSNSTPGHLGWLHGKDDDLKRCWDTAAMFKSYRGLPGPSATHTDICGAFPTLESCHGPARHQVSCHACKLQNKTRRRMARERRGAGSSLVSMETSYYKTIY